MNPNIASPGQGEPDYGIDAPGVRRGMLIAGCSGLVVVLVVGVVGFPASSAKWISVLGSIVAAYGLFMGTYMTYGSRIGKLRTREALLDMASALRPWTGAETILDVGCGRGLMLVGAARRLTTGRAFGVDLWRKEDHTSQCALRRRC